VAYRIGEYELDQSTRALTVGGEAVHVEPQVFELLLYLVVNRDRAVAKTELLDAIWGDQFVSESALTTRIKSARAALGDNGREQQHIRTVHGFGYRLVSEVVEVTVGRHADPSARQSRAAESMPRFPTPFRGRADECREVASLLERHRVVTLLGPGGIGKTRLAVEVVGATAEGAVAARPPVFVNLAATGADGAVAAAIASTLGIEVGQRRDPMHAVLEYLDAVPHLVVLDNCEHVLSGANAAAGEIVAGTADACILATSREPLGFGFERLYRLGPLPLMSDTDVITVDTVVHNPAVAMFLDRARLAGDEALSDASDAKQIVELCRALEGLPLALELAAGRVAAFGVADLLGLLDRRLDILGDHSTAREHRHRTLRSTVEWSYDLLGPDEQRLLRSLAVFPAGVTIEAIDWLTERLGLEAHGLDLVARLVDASLLVRQRTRFESRYTQLETLRAFGLEQLDARDETGAVRDIAAGFTLDLLARAEVGLASADEALWSERIRRGFANIQSTRDHLARHDRADELLEMSRRLTSWGRFRDATEVWAWSDDLLERFADPDPRYAAALAIHAQAAWRRGDIAGAVADAQAALDRDPDDWTRAQALSELGPAIGFAGDLPASVRTFVARDALGADAWSLGAAAVVSAYTGDLERARSYVARAHETVLSTPAPSMVAWMEYCTAETENTVGRADLAMLDRAIERAREVDATFVVGVAGVTRASVQAGRGDVAGAALSYLGLIRHWLRSGSWTQQWTTLRNVAEIIEDSDPPTALTILRAAESDRFSSSVLVDESAARLEALRARLEQRIGAQVGPVPRRIDVAEMALAALTRLAA
jgi:predicted ATPase/DNA-binding winged helix-turn-helix (wHTH) protein